MHPYSAIELVQRHGDEFCEGCGSYGEPGYSDPESGVLFANWNNVPKHIARGLERRGFELEWSDEWHISHETGKAYRTSPDSYGWTPYYVITDDGDIIGGDEIESGKEAEWYVNEYLLNDPARANVFRGLDIAQFGFRKHDSYETGFHPGQNDDPSKVFAALSARGFDVVFSIDGVGQFDAHWSAWIRKEECDDSDDEWNGEPMPETNADRIMMALAESDKIERELNEMRNARPTFRPEEDGPDWAKAWNDTSAE